MLETSPELSTRGFTIRRALPRDVRQIAKITQPYIDRNILVAKKLIAYFEDVQEFMVAVDEGTNEVVACGALHVLWDDIAEVRTLAVSSDYLGRGLGSLLLRTLIARARCMELERVFCLTFEVDFFARHGFEELEGMAVGVDVYEQMLETHDDGVREFLDLASVKPNTLGNTRMILELSEHLAK
ncbi:MAG: amino-acid N-acetyltransferase [Actinomycetaceae bacterium]|nr:amino-acid N-acetyltransferase [Actinomycetaceae bacterium]